MILPDTIPMEIRHFHLFGGLGGGALGFQNGHARAGRLEARFRCIGAVDVDPAACVDFQRLTGQPETCLDLFDAYQYERWHGHAPPRDWRPATAADIRRAAGGESPHIVFTSPPCKGFSGLLNPGKAASEKYQALNELTIRSIALTLEAFADDPPEFVILENVPRIQNRGRPLLEDIVTVLRCHGYAVAETTHDCGEVGGLGQTRKRFLLVARHKVKVPPFLYEPPTTGLRSVGDVVGELPLPGEPGWSMHGLPALELGTWLRLALIEAGKDWRSLQGLNVTEGVLRDLVPLPAGTDWYPGVLGVKHWTDTSGTVAGRSSPTNGAFSVSDPRVPGTHRGGGKYGVTAWDETSRTVISESGTGNGAFAVQDPRFPEWRSPTTGRVNAYGQYGVRPWEAPASTVTGQSAPGGGPNSIPDPRWNLEPGDRRFNNVFRVVRWAETCPSVTGGTGPSAGGLAIEDPRVAAWEDGRENFKSGGHYGVIAWDQTAGTVVGHAKHDRNPASVADVRTLQAFGSAPGQWNKAAPPLIVSLDGTWHRPLTTLELAALQGFPWWVIGQGGGLHGVRADARHRERIVNAVPPPAAAAIASVMGRALLAAWSGVRVDLSKTAIWVQRLAIPMSVDLGEA